MTAWCLLSLAFNPTSRPAETDRAPTSQPGATSRPAASSDESTSVRLSSGDPVVDDLLDQLEKKGKEIEGLSAEIVYRHITTIPVDAEQKKFGQLLYVRGKPNAAFLIHFTKLIVDGIVSENHEYYSFDGRWYVERKDAEGEKTVLRREISRAGERMDAFELGKGPFPLPFGQKREDILTQFEVSLAVFRQGDPAGTRHLHCVPRKDSRMADEYSRVEFYYDPQIGLPVKFVTQRRADEVRVEVEFNRVKLDAAPAMSRFKIETPPGFRETVESLEDEPKIDITPDDDFPIRK